MNIVIERNQLIQGLTVVGKAITGKSQLEVLKGVLFEAKAGKLVLTGSDNDMTIGTMISADVVEEGRVLVEYKILNDIVRKLPNADITIKTTEDNMLDISCNKSNLQLLCLAEEDFPKFPKFENKLNFAISRAKFKEMILGVAYAAAEDSARPILQGILLENKNKVFSTVALDGYRLAVKRHTVECDDFEIVCVKKHLVEVAKLLNETGDINISISQNHLMLRLGATIIVSRLLEGTYVAYNSLINDSHKLTIEVNREELLETVERANLICKDQSSSPLHIYLKDNIFTIKCNGSISKMVENIDINVLENELEDFKIAFNSNYLIDLLRNHSVDKIQLLLSSSVQPCIVKPIFDNIKSDDLNLILPVRIAETN